MSRSYINEELRRIVIARAEQLCEYCLVHHDDMLYPPQVDHAISEKHGGPTQEDNLAYACQYCNVNKGSDVGSFVPGTRRLVRFFNPRWDRWSKHFALGNDGFTIEMLTDIGRATARILQFNHPRRLYERQMLRMIDRYPTSAARKRMGEED